MFCFRLVLLRLAKLEVGVDDAAGTATNKISIQLGHLFSCLRDAQDMLGACPQAVLSLLSDQVEGLQKR